MLTAYISGALIGSRDLTRARALYERFADACRDAGWLPYLPHRRTDPANNDKMSADSVFDVDLDELQNAHALVVYLGEPSLGVGAELAIAMQSKKLIFGLHEDSRGISRFVGGMLNRYEWGKLYRYQSTDDAVEWIRDQLARVKTESTVATI